MTPLNPDINQPLAPLRDCLDIASQRAKEISDVTVFDTRKRIIAANSEEYGFTLDNSFIGVSHDLCHVFGEATTGHHLHEFVRGFIEQKLGLKKTGVDYDKNLTTQDLHQLNLRGDTILALWQVLSNGESLSNLDPERLDSFPITMFAMMQEPTLTEQAAVVGYSFMDAKIRTALVTDFIKDARDNAISIQASPALIETATQHVPAYMNLSLDMPT